MSDTQPIPSELDELLNGFQQSGYHPQVKIRAKQRLTAWRDKAVREAKKEQITLDSISLSETTTMDEDVILAWRELQIKKLKSGGTE